jgi:hypothetical protein
MKAKELDEKFDNNENVLEYFDLTNIRRPGWENQELNIEFPQWMIQAIEREARRLGVNSESLIKVWIGERLEKYLAVAVTDLPPTNNPDKPAPTLP